MFVIRNVQESLKAIAFLFLMLVLACQENPSIKTKILQKETMKVVMVKPDPQKFETIINGKKVKLYTLQNKKGVTVCFTNYGQHIVSLFTPDRNGVFEDIVLGFDTLEGYQKSSGKYFGSVIGRYGNRIGKGRFTLDGTTYNLAKNNGENHLHGGNLGFESVVWEVDFYKSSEIQFSRVSPDGEEGYPGNLMVIVHYKLTEKDELMITYEAKTDKKTLVNLTHHSFFNLKGHGEGTVEDHILTLNADRFTPVDTGLIPTGKLQEVKNTPFDFTQPKKIGQDIDADDIQLDIAKGYDHNYVLNGGSRSASGLTFAAKVVEPDSGRTLEVYTDEPGIQLYTGNFLNGEKGKSDKKYAFRGAFCLETQHFPDSPNQPDFPSTILKPDETYTSHCTYKFGTE